MHLAYALQICIADTVSFILPQPTYSTFSTDLHTDLRNIDKSQSCITLF